MNKKIAIFEEIDHESYEKLIEHLKSNFIVYFSSIKNEIKNKKEIINAIRDKRIIDLNDVECRYALRTEAWKYSYRILDKIFEEDYAKNSSIRNMTKLLHYPALINMYKKKLLDELIKYYEFIFMVNELAESKEVVDVYIQDSELLDAEKKREYGFRIVNKKIRLYAVDNVVDKIKKEITKIVYLFYPWYLFLKKISIFSVKERKTEFKVGITVDQPAGIFSRRYYGEDILIDKKELPKENVLFIDESKGTELKEYAKNNFNCISLKRSKNRVSINLLKRIIFKFFPVWIKTILNLAEDKLTFRTSCKIMSDYILWNMLLDNYKITNYVRRMVPDTISKITILRDYGVKTWMYYPDASAADNIEWNEDCSVDCVFGFMDYDYAVIYGRRTKKFFQSHRNKIGKYIENGVLYAQLASEIEEGKLENNLNNYIKEKNFPKKIKIIGLFDTTFSNSAPLHPKEGYKFGKDMLKILKKFNNIGIIFKVKYPWEELDEKIREVYEELRNHERCIILSTKDGRWGSSSEVIAKSDIAISAAYTSPTMEALGAHKKAIFYDVGSKNIGKGYYYNRFPNLVAHSYKELEKLIEYWLYDVNEKQFEDYLNKYIKDELDPYMDKKALSRFRKMLAQ